MADDEAKLLADAKRLPLAERVEHSNWKIRSAAYEDIKSSCESAFSNTDPILDESGPLFAKSVGDTNANAMDKALDALCAWLTKADESQASRIASSVCSTIASKCLKARTATLNKATEACLLFAELEQANTMIDNISSAFQDKIPKVVLAALDIVYRTVAEFGIDGVVDPKPIIKALPSLFSHSNAGVRDKVKELTVELAAFAGAPLVRSTLIDKMNDAMKKDVEANISALPQKRKQAQRFTRREAKERRANSGGGHGGGDVDGDDDHDNNNNNDDVDMMDVDHGDMDPYDFSDPVDIIPQLRKTMVTVGDDTIPFWDCFDSKKWNVRKGALDAAKTLLASTPRLAANQEYSDVCRELKKVLAKDANIACAAAAADVTGLLARGLRREFTANARQLCGVLLERFKEKNTGMSKSAEDSLRTMATYCYSLSDVSDDIISALSHKNPKVRLDTLRLLCFMVVHSDAASDINRSKDGVIQSVVKLAPDADPTIREAAQTVLVAYALKLGSFSAIKSYLSSLDDSRSKMIEDAVMSMVKNGGLNAMIAGMQKNGTSGSNSSAVQSSSSRAVTPGRPTSTTSTASSSLSNATKSTTATNNNNNTASIKRSTTTTTRTTSASTSRPSSATTTKTTTTAPPPSSSSSSGQIEQDIAAATSSRLSPDEAEQRLVDQFGSSIVEELRSPQWQARLEAITTISDQLSQQKDDPTTASYLLCLAHVPGWNEKNFQVLNKIFEVAALLAKECPGFNTKEAAAVVEGAGDKIHELKHRLQASEALSTASEAVGPRFVAAYLHSRAAANKNPKVLSEALSWLATTVDDFGVAALDIPSIIRWMIEDLGSPNAPVRNQAMAVLGRCHAQIGSGLVAQVSSAVKPAQLTALEEIFRKNPADPEYVPIRKAKKRKNNNSNSNNTRSGAGAAGQGDTTTGATDNNNDGMDDDNDDDESEGVNLDDLLPRVDISAQLASSLVSQIGSSNWKERNAALESIESILQSAGHRITPNVPSELFSELRGRISDTNRNLAARALLLIGKLADSIGAPFDKLARPILSSTLLALSDNKKQVRDAVMSMLDSWIKTTTPERLFPATVDGIANPKCSIDGRVAVLTWMGRCVVDASKQRTKDGRHAALQCIDAVLKAAAVAAGDKSGAVREAGVKLLIDLVQCTSGDAVVAGLSSVDGQTRKAVEASVQKAINSSGSSSGSGNNRTTVSASSSPSLPPKSSQKQSTATTPYRQQPPPSLTTTTTFINNDTNSDAQPILAMNTGKAQRTKQFRPRIGKFEPPTPSEIDLLEQYLSPLASEEFRSQLFSQDFRDHLKAADALSAAIPSLLPEITASLDLILRWAVLRICDGNPQALLRVLEALRVIFSALADQGYECNEIEINVILPAIVEKCGHNQDRVRSLYRDVLYMICRVYPIQRVVECVIVQGMSGSKNSRTRVECCEFLAVVVQEQGAHVMLGSKVKPMTVLAGILKERDGTLRSAALSVIEAVFAEQGTDTTWKLLGRLDAREKDMIEDRLKRSSKQNSSGNITTTTTVKKPSSSLSLYNNNTGSSSIGGQDNQYNQHRTPRPLAFDTNDGYTNDNNTSMNNGQQEDDDDDIDYSGYDQHNRARLSSYMAASDNNTNNTNNTMNTMTTSFEYARQRYTPPNALDMTPPDGYTTNSNTIHDDTTTTMPSLSSSNIPTPVPKPRFQSPSHNQQQQHHHSIDDTTTTTMNTSTTTTSPIPAIGPHDAEFEQRWAVDLKNINTESLPDAIEATKQLCADLQAITQQTDPPMSRRIRAILVESSQRLFALITAQLEAIMKVAEREAAVTGPGTASSRGCKYALTALLNSIGVQEVATTLPQGTLRDTIAVLLRQLASGMDAFEERSALVKPINVIVGKMLDAADKNLAFAALLQLLREPPKALKSEEIPKFNDFVVKCLIKLTKGLHSNPDSFDFSILLFNLHDFFMFLGVEEIRRRSYADDKPLKMVKTIIHEICKIKGYSIYQYATRIHPGRHSPHPPAIFAYIRSALTSYEKSGVIQPASEEDEAREAEAMAIAHATAGGVGVGGAHTTATTTISSALSGGGGDALYQQSAMSPVGSSQQLDKLDTKAQVNKAEVKQRLKEIMTGLVSRDRGQQDAAMIELYRLKKEKPEYVERYIKGTSDMFRQFIDDGLSKLEAQGTVIIQQQYDNNNDDTSGDTNGYNNNNNTTSTTAIHTTPPPPINTTTNTSLYSTYSAGPSPHSHSRISSIKERLTRIRADESHGGYSGMIGGGMSSAAGPSVEELSRRLEQLKHGSSNK